jgi:sarcosine oxidase subunit beta
MMLAQTEHEIRGYQRTAHANALQGVTTEYIGPSKVKELCPIINIKGPRYPVLGALWQPRGGTARHDAVAWGYARACSDMGMDIIQQTEVTGVRREGGKVVGVDTTKGTIGCDKLGIVVAGHSGVMAERAGFRLPIESVALQALVSEPIKPVMDVVVMANTVHGYMSQSDKGEMVIGGGADGFNNYTQRGSFHHVEETVRALVETFPIISRLKMLRWWGGIVDMTGDRSPIISKTPVDGIFVNCGWGTGGFKAIPGSGWAMAELMARGHSPLADANSAWTGSAKAASSTKAWRRGWRIDLPDPSSSFQKYGRGVWGAGSPPASATSRIIRHADTHLSLLRHHRLRNGTRPRRRGASQAFRARFVR